MGVQWEGIGSFCFPLRRQACAPKPTFFPSSNIYVPFLNLLANVVARAGSIQIRVGGNTQENAVLKESLPNNTILSKDYDNLFNPTGTPPIDYTPDLFYMMANISNFVNVNWYVSR